jgi:drug/metabolite transporter (DMT)-like permease
MLTTIMIAAIVLSNSAGDVWITKGMKELGEVSSLDPRVLLRIILDAAVNKNIVFGVLSLAVSFISFLSILSWKDMSFVVPATSTVYVVSIVGARIFLKERITGLRLAGSFMVCLGVALICAQ